MAILFYDSTCVFNYIFTCLQPSNFPPEIKGAGTSHLRKININSAKKNVLKVYKEASCPVQEI